MYVRVSDKGQVVQFPFKPEQIRRMYKNVSFPSTISNEILAEYNVFPVVQTAAPSFDTVLETVSSSVEFIDDNWALTYTVTPKNDTELRGQLDQKVQQKLDESLDSVMQYLEVNEPIPDNLSNYRRVLRTIHLQPGYPYEVEWPRLFKDTESSGA